MVRRSRNVGLLGDQPPRTTQPGHFNLNNNRREWEPMRQGQQNRRGRGRNNNNSNVGNNQNRKSQNPLTRSFESAGPDVKLRGTPSHIAEKYITLARDALSSGDRVLAENYLQHAEHYNRIIMTYREQQMSQGGTDPFNNGQARTHSLNSPEGGDGDEFGDEDSGDDFGQPMSNQGNAPQFSGGNTTGGQPQFGDGPAPQSQQRYDNRPQRNEGRDTRADGRNDGRNDGRHDGRQDNRPDNRPDNRNENRPFNNNRNDRNSFRSDRPERNDRPDRQDRGDRNERSDRGDRSADPNSAPRQFRDDRGPQERGNQDRGPQHDNGRAGPNGNGFRRRERYQGGDAAGAERDHGRDHGLPGQGPQPVAPMMSQPIPVAPVIAPPPPIAAPALELEQPAFLRRPVRRPRRDDTAAAEVAAPAAVRTPTADDSE